MAEAAAQGIPRVMWLTMRTADVIVRRPELPLEHATRSATTTASCCRRPSSTAAGCRSPTGRRTSAGQRRSGSAADGIHYTATGAHAAAQFIVSQASAVLAGGSITPSPGASAQPAAWVTLRRGDRGPLVATVQRALARLGISVVGGADGVFGAYTEAAVRRFQSSRGLPATGVADAATAAAMGLIAARYRPPPPCPAPRRRRRGPTCEWEVVAQPLPRLSAPSSTRASSCVAAQTASTGRTQQPPCVCIKPTAGSPRPASSTPRLRRRWACSPHRDPSGRSNRAVLPRRGRTPWCEATRCTALPARPASRSGISSPSTTSTCRSVIHPGMVLTVAAGSGAAAAGQSDGPTWPPAAAVLSVAAAQRAIINPGIFLRGGADGVFGPYYPGRAAPVPGNRGLPQTGVVDTATAVSDGSVHGARPSNRFYHCCRSDSRRGSRDSSYDRSHGGSDRRGRGWRRRRSRPRP